MVNFRCCSVAQSRLILCNPQGLQHTRPPCPSPSPRVCSHSCPSSWWCHPTISSSAVPFSSCLQLCPASGSFPMSQLFVSHGQSIGASASACVLPVNIQGWFPLGWTSLISLQFNKYLWPTDIQCSDYSSVSPSPQSFLFPPKSTIALGVGLKLSHLLP